MYFLKIGLGYVEKKKMYVGTSMRVCHDLYNRKWGFPNAKRCFAPTITGTSGKVLLTLFSILKKKENRPKSKNSNIFSTYRWCGANITTFVSLCSQKVIWSCFYIRRFEKKVLKCIFFFWDAHEKNLHKQTKINRIAKISKNAKSSEIWNSQSGMKTVKTAKMAETVKRPNISKTAVTIKTKKMTKWPKP